MWTIFVDDHSPVTLWAPAQIDATLVNAINQDSFLSTRISAALDDGALLIQNLQFQDSRFRFETDNWDSDPFIIEGNPTASVPLELNNGGMSFTVCLSSAQPMFRITPIVARSAYDVAVDNGYVGSEVQWLGSLHGADGADADPTDLTNLTSRVDEIYLRQTEISVENGVYANGQLLWVSGTIDVGNPPVKATGITIPGLHTVSLTISNWSVNQVFAVYADTRDDLLGVGSIAPFGIQCTSGSRIAVSIDSGQVFLDEFPVSNGDVVDITFSNTTLSVHINGIAQVVTGNLPTPLGENAKIHILSLAVNGYSPLPLTVAIPNIDVRSGLLPTETNARIAGDALLQSNIDAIYVPGPPTGLTALAYNGAQFEYTSDVQTLGYGVARWSTEAATEGVLITPPINNATLAIALCSGDAGDFDATDTSIGVGNGQLIIGNTAVVVPVGTPTPIKWTSTTLSAYVNNAWVDVVGQPVSNPQIRVIMAGETVNPLQFTIPGLSFETATGLLPDETAARIAGDAALMAEFLNMQMGITSSLNLKASQVDLNALQTNITGLSHWVADKADQAALDLLAGTVADVQTLAQVNQLNIAEKADQLDVETLQATVTGQGLTLAQKADQTALSALSAVVDGKATPADVTAAVAALVGAAPEALNTIYKLAAELADDQPQLDALLALVGLCVQVGVAQSFTAAQQLQARQNIGAEAVGVAAALVAAITAASIGAATAIQGAKADTALQSGDMSPVAFTGLFASIPDKELVLQVLLSGYVLGSNTPVSAADTILQALGKIQAQINFNKQAASANADWNATSGVAQILNKPTLLTLASVLTGLAAGTNTPITASDSLLQALQNLQAQASANAQSAATNTALLAPVPRKFGTSWYQSGLWYGSGYPGVLQLSTQTLNANTIYFVDFPILENITTQNIGVYLSGAGASGATLSFAIYGDNGGQPANLIWQSGSLDGTTVGNKIAPCAQTFTGAGRCWLALMGFGTGMAIYAVYRAGAGHVEGPHRLFNTPVLSGSSFPANASSAAAAPLLAPRIMLQAQ